MGKWLSLQTSSQRRVHVALTCIPVSWCFTYFRMPSSHEFSITRNAYEDYVLLRTKMSVKDVYLNFFVQQICSRNLSIYEVLIYKSVPKSYYQKHTLWRRMYLCKIHAYEIFIFYYYFFNKSFVLLVILWTCKKVRSRPMHHRSLWKDDKN